MNFLAAVNRVFRSEGIIRGDTDEITAFSNLQHGATTQLAMIAIQDELNELLSDQLFPVERDASGSVVTTSSVRSYSLASDFVQFYGVASLYDAANNLRLFEYPGGEAMLQQAHPDYKVTESEPIHWYFDAGATKKIAFWPVPQAAKTYTYDYEADSSVTSASDTLPFQNEIEAQAFCRLATRRFKFLRGKMDVALLVADPEHIKAKAALARLITGKNTTGRYGPVYR